MLNLQDLQAVAPLAGERDPFLVALGERMRSLRARRGLSRRALAQTSEVSERHLANLELGQGNASILVLRQIAQALEAPLAELLGDETAASPEWLLIRDLLRHRGDDDLRRAREALAELYGERGAADQRTRRIALVGLRGAGKSTLGRMLADELDVSFVELSTEIERVAGCGLGEIYNLMGPNAYRRYERRALEEAIQIYPKMVLATPGGLVSDAATFNVLLGHCLTVWLQAEPRDHMARVIAQGDFRPMSGNQEAMEDLQRILAGRHAFYAKADLHFNTSGQSFDATLAGLLERVTESTAGKAA